MNGASPADPYVFLPPQAARQLRKLGCQETSGWGLLSFDGNERSVTLTKPKSKWLRSFVGSVLVLLAIPGSIVSAISVVGPMG
jgi:hypothetical protein